MKRQNRSILNGLLIAATLVSACALVGAVSMTPMAKAATQNYKSLGFQSPKEMENYLTIGSSEIHEIPTQASVVQEYDQVIVTIGPVQVNVPDAPGQRPAPIVIPGTPSLPTPGGPTPGGVVIPGINPGSVPGAPPIPGASPLPGASPIPGMTPLPTPVKPVIPPGAGPLDPSSIIPWITLGEKIWSLIAANKPVANVQTQRVYVLPVAQQDWSQMENWKGPAAHTFRMEYKNLYGVSVITHTYTLAFNYGGTYNDAGHFLANVTMIPSSVTVGWGFTLNTSVEVGSAVNTSTKADPLPGLEMQLVTKIDTVIKHIETRDVFFVRGDGTYQQMTDSNGAK